MLSGRERAAMRWEARESLLRHQLERVEEHLRAIGEPSGQRDVERIERLRREREDLLASLTALGPNPRSKMG
ncbi:MAG TPA: hypothetical protein VF807_00555 [Ktedonobacterales bacterium]